MRIYMNPARKQWATILQRPALETEGLDKVVRDILDDIRRRGDQAVLEYTRRFDGAELDDPRVKEADRRSAADRLDARLKKAIRQAIDNVELFHRQQHQAPEVIETMPGVQCWRKSVPIDKVGLYIPGGTAPLFSSIVMLGVPARLAGCREIVLCTPPRPDGSLHPAMLYTAELVGIEQVFRIGGVQAIGAMAYGTETVPSVYKIFGPGNQYVTAAKQVVARGGVALDMPAGPSEVLVCAGESARPAFVAADLLSQAEHGADSQVVLVAFSQDMVQAIQAEIDRQLPQLPRQDIARQALAHSAAVVVPDPDTAVDLINAYAPEHLILALDDPRPLAERITNAGSVFLGHYSPESVGDYASGTNHTLPTNGYARAYSGVSLDSFVKKITFQELSAEGLRRIGPTVEALAEAEELLAHKRAVTLRTET